MDRVLQLLMDFAGAAASTWEEAEGTETGDLLEAYCAGVNRHLGRSRRE